MPRFASSNRGLAGSKYSVSREDNLYRVENRVRRTVLKHLEQGKRRDVDRLGCISDGRIRVRSVVAHHLAPSLEILKHLRVHGYALNPTSPQGVMEKPKEVWA